MTDGDPEARSPTSQLSIFLSQHCISTQKRNHPCAHHQPVSSSSSTHIHNWANHRTDEKDDVRLVVTVFCLKIEQYSSGFGMVGGRWMGDYFRKIHATIPAGGGLAVVGRRVAQFRINNNSNE